MNRSGLPLKRASNTGLTVAYDRRVRPGWLLAGKSWVLPILGMLLLLTGGCSSPSGHRGRSFENSKGGTDEIHLFGVPIALDFDGKRGPDGFAVRVYMSSSGRAKGVPITSGSLEILMFDGLPVLPGGNLGTPKRVWTFTPADLKPYAEKTAIGIGYRFALQWESSVPSGNRITVFARWKRARGNTITSDPSTISTVLR
jgi:hypothetical protein